ncbi:MAG: hypothetical protein ACSW8D_00805 [Prevotella sp.]
MRLSASRVPPASSFIPYCKELLDRYENNLRIGMIAGFNPEGKTASPYDYLFTTMLPVGGWATWRRVVEDWDENYTVVDNEYDMHQLEALSRRKYEWREMPEKLRLYRQSRRPVCEAVLWSFLTLHSCLTIVPARNMIGGKGACHEQAFPLRHPRLVVEDGDYRRRRRSIATIVNGIRNMAVRQIKRWKLLCLR